MTPHDLYDLIIFIFPLRSSWTSFLVSFKYEKYTANKLHFGAERVSVTYEGAFQSGWSLVDAVFWNTCFCSHADRSQTHSDVSAQAVWDSCHYWSNSNLTAAECVEFRVEHLSDSLQLFTERQIRTASAFLHFSLLTYRCVSQNVIYSPNTKGDVYMNVHVALYHAMNLNIQILLKVSFCFMKTWQWVNDDRV